MKSSVSLRGSWSEWPSSDPRSADLENPAKSLPKPWKSLVSTVRNSAAGSRARPTRTNASGRKLRDRLQLDGPSKIRQSVPHWVSLSASLPRPHAPIRPPIIGGWSSAPKASIEPPYRMRSGSMPDMQGEQETANQRPWRRESDRRGRKRIEQLCPMCQFPVATKRFRRRAGSPPASLGNKQTAPVNRG